MLRDVDAGGIAVRSLEVDVLDGARHKFANQSGQLLRQRNLPVKDLLPVRHGRQQMLVARAPRQRAHHVPRERRDLLADKFVVEELLENVKPECRLLNALLWGAVFHFGNVEIHRGELVLRAQENHVDERALLDTHVAEALVVSEMTTLQKQQQCRVNKTAGTTLFVPFCRTPTGWPQNPSRRRRRDWKDIGSREPQKR